MILTAIFSPFSPMAHQRFISYKRLTTKHRNGSMTAKLTIEAHEVPYQKAHPLALFEQ